MCFSLQLLNILFGDDFPDHFYNFLSFRRPHYPYVPFLSLLKKNTSAATILVSFHKSDVIISASCFFIWASPSLHSIADPSDDLISVPVLSTPTGIVLFSKSKYWDIPSWFLRWHKQFSYHGKLPSRPSLLCSFMPQFRVQLFFEFYLNLQQINYSALWTPITCGSYPIYYTSHVLSLGLILCL